MIKKGLVKVNGAVCTKSAYDVKESDLIEYEDIPYSSQGGYKLELAIKNFGIDIKDKICIDIGASNGGFTDCLLSHKAKKVYAVDVAECALQDRLINDERVIVKDNLNARYIEFSDIGEYADVIVIDVSYISVKLILNEVKKLLNSGGVIIALIKPQFETGGAINKSGIIDIKKHPVIIEDIKSFCLNNNLILVNLIKYTPIMKKKNIEYLSLIKVVV
jgi:23S rRNA (cytidine1920-2'-O)/16S rRNA (cytidine1409-2'-O)-methyltransferase